MNKLLATLTLSILASSTVYSAVSAVNGVTTTGTTDLTLTGFTTVDGGNYTNLIGATVTNGGSDALYWDFGGTDPITSNAALSGLVITDGTLNTANGTNFQIGSLGVNTTLFLFEHGFSNPPNNADDVILAPIDVNGNVIGDYTLTLIDIARDNSGVTTAPYYGNYLNNVTDRASGNNLNSDILGYTFTLNDFSGTTGTIALATGLQIVNNNPQLGRTSNTGPLDIAVVGAVVVPEPSSAALFAGLLGLSSIMLRRRC